jgi:O-antigen/teichoic acid export membrane protein
MQPSEPARPPQAARFLIDVLWNWLAVGTNIFAGVLLTPYIIRKLGDERYGIWALAFALIEYVFLFDLGFRSAIVTFVSRYRVRGETERINEVINTSLGYLAAVAAFVMTAAFYLSGHGSKLFKITPGDQADFAFLIRLIGFTWATGIMSNIFQASLEAFQKFKVYSHILVLMMVIRSGGCATLLLLGHGLRAMGVLVVTGQFLGYTLMFITFWRAFPALRFSTRLFVPARWKEMAGYGVHSLVASFGSLTLNQGPPLIVGHYLPEAFVGYYTVPSRLLQYLVELTARIGFVTVPKTAELLAAGRTDQIIRLGIHINRYCLALFTPATTFLMVYATPLIERWIGPTYAVRSAPLLPILAVGIYLGVAGQFNSSQILFGMAKHGPYARSIVAEAVCSAIGIALVLPRFGIYGAACVVAGFMVLNRGMICPWILCHQLHFSYFRYMAGIYTRPLLSAIVIGALAVGMKSFVVAGQTWGQLLIAVAVIGCAGLILCLFTCVEAEHRQVLRDTLLRKLKAMTA